MCRCDVSHPLPPGGPDDHLDGHGHHMHSLQSMHAPRGRGRDDKDVHLASPAGVPTFFGDGGAAAITRPGDQDLTRTLMQEHREIVKMFVAVHRRSHDVTATGAQREDAALVTHELQVHMQSLRDLMKDAFEM